MDEKLRETTNLGVEIMNSKREDSSSSSWKVGNLVTWHKFAFGVDANVMVNLSIGQVYPSVTVPEVFGKVNSAQFLSLFSRGELTSKDKFAVTNDFLFRVEWGHNGLLRWRLSSKRQLYTAVQTAVVI